MRFAMGCNDPSAGRQLLDRSPRNMDDAVRRVKTYQRSAVGLLMIQGLTNPIARRPGLVLFRIGQVKFH